LAFVSSHAPPAVAPTQAGEQLISRLDPALGEVESVLDQIVGLRERPTGRVRLLVTPLSATMVLAPKLVAFARRFPDIVLDVTTTQEGRTELVASGFDAGIHLGESIQRDMVAVRVSRDQRLAIVGSPDYFALHPKPSSPHELLTHRCIRSSTARSPSRRSAFSLRTSVSEKYLGDQPDRSMKTWALWRRMEMASSCQGNDGWAIRRPAAPRLGAQQAAEWFAFHLAAALNNSLRCHNARAALMKSIFMSQSPAWTALSCQGLPSQITAPVSCTA
jgi:DNA-binding transcriptional LysR family regulator